MNWTLMPGEVCLFLPWQTGRHTKTLHQTDGLRVPFVPPQGTPTCTLSGLPMVWAPRCLILSIWPEQTWAWSRKPWCIQPLKTVTRSILNIQQGCTTKFGRDFIKGPLSTLTHLNLLLLLQAARYEFQTCNQVNEPSLQIPLQLSPAPG